MSLLSIKVRVMPARLLLLSRFFLRLDDVIFRVRDTRIYVEFETGQVIRDYTSMEGVYSRLKEVGPIPPFVTKHASLVGNSNNARWFLIRRILDSF
jgi:hypothetical protein